MKKQISLFLAAALLLGGLAGCGQAPGASSDGAGTSTPSSKSGESTPLLSGATSSADHALILDNTSSEKPNDSASTGTKTFNPDDFMKYFKDFPQFFHDPVANTSELSDSAPAGFFLVYETFFLNKANGFSFEQDESGDYLIPEEMIAQTARELLGIEFDFSCIKDHPSECGSRVPGTNYYRFTTAIDIATGKISVDESSLQFEQNQIEINASFTYHPPGPGDFVTLDFTYQFAFQPDNSFPYQLQSITSTKS